MSSGIALKEKIDLCQGQDRHRFRRRLARLDSSAAEHTKLERAINESIARRQRRADMNPTLIYPDDLPVSERRVEIAEAITNHQIVIVCGETGSGKTTQLPKICLDVGRGIDGLIGHTQPRRLAARTVAARIADEMQTKLGDQIGFQTRFQQNLGDRNLVKVMTDGILLAEIRSDRWLNRYDTIILDEAHERSLNVDFLLGYLKRLLVRRDDLKLIVTSATLDVERIAGHFNGAPVIEVKGRTFPVELRYRPLESPEEDADDLDINRAIHDAIVELQEAGRGDCLVFLPGEREIREASKSLRSLRDRFDIHALYARLSSSEQQRIFQRGRKTRIILATNVAETSLTVPGIRYVIDSGTARISRYSWRAQIQRLPGEKISRASASQRAGRCGRTAPGICNRLFAEDDFLSRDEFTQPEIQRTNLAAVILQMASLGLGEIEKFPFIDPPEPRLVGDGYRLLRELQAVNANTRLTSTGELLARLPIDPRLGRMLLAAAQLGSLSEVLVIVTALAVQDPRDRPFDKRQAADEQHARFNQKRSDFSALLELWNYLETQSEELSQSALRRLCRQEFINYKRWRDWRDLHRQLKLSLRELGLTSNSTPSEYDEIHRALLSGLLDHLGHKDEKGGFVGSRNRRFFPFPGSALRNKPPKWIMAAEITETSRVYARTIARIEPQWVEEQGAHLLKRQYSEPHWQKKAARVGGYEKVLLNGLVIHPRRLVDYSKIDEKVSREIFIQHALVYGQWQTRVPVVLDNQALIRSIEDLEARTRRRDILVDEQSLFDFYDSKIPAKVNSGISFAKWYRNLSDGETLRLTENDLLRDPAATAEAAHYPTSWRQETIELPLSYSFEPGSDSDGGTLTIPLVLIDRIDPERCEWLVPGMLEEKVIALIRALPKRLRKNFIPVPDFAHAATEAMTLYQGSLFAALAQVLLRMTAIEVPDSEGNSAIEPHLLMRFAVRGADGEVIATGRSLEKLKQSLTEAIEARAPAAQQTAFERDSVKGWDFGQLPEQVQCEEDGYNIQRIPALAEEGNQVALRLFDDESVASVSMCAGLRRLIMSELKQEVRYLKKNLSHIQRLCLLFAPIGSAELLKDDIILTAIQRCFVEGSDIPRDQDAFDALVRSRRDHLVSEANILAEHVEKILSLHAELRSQLMRELPLSWIEAAQDINAQLDTLIYPGFIVATPTKWLDRLPRYLKAIQLRMGKLNSAPDRDRLRRSEIEPLFARLLQSSAPTSSLSEQLMEYKWLLEELRISMFAQEFGALEKVSVKRLDRLWEQLH